jgi:hypothetical protein
MSGMDEGIENIIRIASEEFGKLYPPNKATGVDVEEIEKDSSGHYFVTLGYWSRDNKPSVEQGKPTTGVIGNHPIKDPNQRRAEESKFQKAAFENLMNPWRRKYKRIEVDPQQGRAIAIKMYEPPLGVS